MEEQTMLSHSRFLSAVLICILVFAMTGCETMSQHKIATGATIGAVTGAVAGGVIGDKHGNAVEGALIGAAAGAAVGGGIGYYLDRQAKKYETIEQVDVQPVEATQNVEEHLTLRVSNEVLFQQGSAYLSSEGSMKIAEMASVMREYPDTRVIVKGYASEEGDEAYNMALSEQRAQIIRNTLIANRVAPDRITALGMGESNPIADNSTEVGRAQNRRVEIDVFPNEDVK
jgi:outer membrane protein OmpA-like peptidoglycan-associated protein